MNSEYRLEERVLRGVLTMSALCIFVTASAEAQTASRRPLSSADVDDIARLEMLEDRRQFDGAEFGKLLNSRHPEVRRRAAVSIGRIADKRGLPLLRARSGD